SDLIAYKSNALVEASYKLTLQEQRFLLLCISRLKSGADAELQVPNTPLPTLWKSSIHAGSAHITYRKTVRMCSTWRRIHFR
ncbi:replication initiation protein, partial [Escherichia coli]|uniref:replication initiation protein n=1 Tax=Escherichia coli TaxID=562 RepID=UPI003EDFF800